VCWWFVNGWETYITSKLAVVEITLEDGELSALHVVVQLGSFSRQTPETAARSPVTVGSHDQLALAMESGPLLENKQEILNLLVGQGGGDLVLELLVLGLGLEEFLGVGNGIEKQGEVGRKHVGDEPGNRLGSKDDLSGQTRRKQEAGQDEIDVKLEPGVVEDNVNAAFLLPLIASLLEKGICFGEVVDQDVLLSRLAGLASLELLNILVGEVGEQRQISGITPEADLKHLRKE
jgi:hypothetical protein